jgi:RimJ/RimL family protein N-acetyltransferase
VTVNLDALCPTPTLAGRLVRLEALRVDMLPAYRRMLDDPEVGRLTGTHQQFATEDVERWLATRADAERRADWAIVTADEGRFVGEVVLMDVDADNESAGFRIALSNPDEFGRGYGSEATRLVAEFAFAVVGLHRLALEVYDFNARAIATYRRCGFREEGRLRDALRWDGEWHDAIVMSRLAADENP